METGSFSGLKILVFVGLAGGAAAWAQLCTPPPNGMVSWWPADGNATDIIGGHNGTLMGGATFAPGKVGQAFSFNGVPGSFVQIGNPASLSITGPITVDAWVKPNVINTYQAIVNQMSTSNHLGEIQLRINGDLSTFDFFRRNSEGSISTEGISTSGTAIAGSWQHVVGVYDGSSYKIYINGVLDPGGPGTSFLFEYGSFEGPDTRIGSADSGDFFPFNGLIDEVEVFNRALSPAEIETIFTAGSAGKCKPGRVRAAYVANAGSNSVSVINPATNTVAAMVAVGRNPVNLAVTPNGATLYVANAGGNSVSVINTVNNVVVATVTVGSNPLTVAVTPNGGSVYVANAGSNSVSVINTATNTVIATVPVGKNPVNLAVSPDSTTVHVTNVGSNSDSVISTASNTVVATVPVGINPVNVVIH